MVLAYPPPFISGEAEESVKRDDGVAVGGGVTGYSEESQQMSFWIPGMLYKESPTSFKPKVVAIGPLHAKDECVQASLGWKKTHVLSLFSFIIAPQDLVVGSCMSKVYASMTKIREFYECSTSTDLGSDDHLAQIMVLDACFILDLMLMLVEPHHRQYTGNMLIVETMLRDMLLIENQIPFFVLDGIFQRTVLKFKPNASLVELLLPILYCHNLFEADIKNKIKNTAIPPKHILGLLHQCYMPPQVDNNNMITSSHDPSSSRIQSAGDLLSKGIVIKPNEDTTNWLMGIEVKLPRFGFWNNPALVMPVLLVKNHTESVLRNLMAYEYTSCCMDHMYVTSYVRAMGMLVNTIDDVDVLVKSQVIDNCLGSNDEVALMFESILKYDTERVPSLYKEEWKKLNKYITDNFESRMSTCFGWPWGVIVILVGLILYALRNGLGL